MKPAAFILASIWALVMVQPTFAYFGGKSAYGDCSKTVTEKPSCSKKKPGSPACSKKKAIKPTCSKNKCDKPLKSSGKDDCKSQGCNPTLGCSSGNFYAHHYSIVSLHSWLTQKQKVFVSDDNRIVKNMSECWHPPELIS